MNEKPRINGKIEKYLKDVRKHLTGTDKDAVNSIIDDLRMQIETSLDDLGGEPSLAKVKAILTEMDSPESFAAEIDGELIVEHTVSRKAIYGAILLPFGLVLAFSSLFLVSVTSSTDPAGAQNNVAWWQWLLRFTLLPLGIISPFATTILGILSLTEIKRSMGRLTGKFLALLDALFYPLLLLDAILIGLLFVFIGSLPEGSLGTGELLIIMSIPIILIIDVVIFVIAWNRIK